MTEDNKNETCVSVEENMEIRTIFQPSNNLDEGPTEKKYLVHKVDAMCDTLFQLSYRYKVSMKEI